MMLANAALFASTLISILPKFARPSFCSTSAVCQGAAAIAANLSSITIIAGDPVRVAVITSMMLASGADFAFPHFRHLIKLACCRSTGTVNVFAAICAANSCCRTSGTRGPSNSRIMMLANAALCAPTLTSILPKFTRPIICSRSAVCQGAAACTANISIWAEAADVRAIKTMPTSGANNAFVKNHSFPRLATVWIKTAWNKNAVSVVAAHWATPRSSRTSFAVCPVGAKHMMLAVGALLALTLTSILPKFARIRPRPTNSRLCRSIAVNFFTAICPANRSIIAIIAVDPVRVAVITSMMLATGAVFAFPLVRLLVKLACCRSMATVGFFAAICAANCCCRTSGTHDPANSRIMMLAIFALFALTLIRMLPKFARPSFCSKRAVCQGAAVIAANLSSITIYAVDPSCVAVVTSMMLATGAVFAFPSIRLLIKLAC
jgi:hypothetical protein